MLDHRAVPSLSQAMLRELTLDDDEELELIQSTLGPWTGTGGDVHESHPPPGSYPHGSSPMTHPTHPTRPSGATAQSSRIKVVVGSITNGKPFRPAAKTNPSSSSFLPVLPTNPHHSPRNQQQHNQTGVTQCVSPRTHRRLQHGPRDASPLVKAYQALVEQSETMVRKPVNAYQQQQRKCIDGWLLVVCVPQQEASYEDHAERRRLNQVALQLGITQLSDDRIAAQKQILRFNTLKNEVDIFQQCLDPFVFEMRTDHERQVNSSVYRHFTRMQAVQEMGIPVYSLGTYLQEEHDKILTARTDQTFYRRIRRRNAGHYMDTELIPRPMSKRKSVILTASSSAAGANDLERTGER